jgi:hypothetical protein
MNTKPLDLIAFLTYNSAYIEKVRLAFARLFLTRYLNPNDHLCTGRRGFLVAV